MKESHTTKNKKSRLDHHVSHLVLVLLVRLIVFNAGTFYPMCPALTRYTYPFTILLLPPPAANHVPTSCHLVSFIVARPRRLFFSCIPLRSNVTLCMSSFSRWQCAFAVQQATVVVP